MPRPQRKFLLALCWTAVAAGLCGAASAQSISALRSSFDAPSAEARPWVFWYWLKGRVSPEGITADLEAMRAAGLSGAYLMPIQGPEDPPLFDPPATQLSPRFWEMVRHAAREADRLGLQFGMHVCDGFATAGGPWITPELSMQRLTWSEAHVTGGEPIEVDLPQPPIREGYYRDVATLALPCPPGWEVGAEVLPSRVTTSDGETNAERLARADNDQRYRSAAPCWIEYEYETPHTFRSVTVSPDGSNYQCQRLTVEASDDGADWRLVAQLDAPRHGWQDEGRPVTHALPPTTARRFRFRWTPAGSEPGAEDLDSAKWAPVLKVQSIVFSPRAQLHQFRGKAAEVWRQSPRTTTEQCPAEACVPFDQVVDLSDRVDEQGRLAWDAPPGDWLVLRFGHTSTGKQNATAGGGIGLECDKLSGRAVRLQFDNWFGEAQRQIADEIGADAMRRVLTTLHLDSWECGAQNWTPNFPEEYSKRHDGDLTRWLPTIAGVPIESAEASERFLRNFRATIADLVADEFYGGLREIADEQGLRFTGECTAPTFPGDGMRHFAKLDAPMGEFWLNSPTHDKPNDMRDAISAAHWYGKRMIQAEAFTQLRIGWDETPASLKRLGDRNLALGANRLVLHVWTHNPWLDRKPGQTLGGVGLYFQRDQPWIHGARGWMDYLARCQAVLQSGEPVVDIAVAAADDYPSRALTPEKLVDRLPGLIGDAAVAREQLRLANEDQPQRVAPVGVRASANIPDPATWTDPLSGYKYDTAPPNGESPAREYEWTHHHGDALWTGKNLTPEGVARDFIAYNENEESPPRFAWTHRRGDGWDAYFVSNQTDDHQVAKLSLRDSREHAEVWDPNSGKTWRATDAILTRGRTNLSLPLEAGQSLFVVLPDSATAVELEAATARVSIDADWRVSFVPAVGETPSPRVVSNLDDLSRQDDLADFAGVARYETLINLAQSESGDRVWLALGGAAALAEVEVNGVDCGVAWTPPWRVDVTEALRTGSNTIVVRTPSVWKNRLLAERDAPEPQRDAWTSDAVRLADDNRAPLGLFGPVELIFTESAD